MPTSPLVSVLMPIYNTNESHLREAIESILRQSFEDFEFLILNDSPENLFLDEIVASYADKRIIYFKNEENLGITPSRNKLITLAKGEYIAVMDHDDISLPKRLAQQVRKMDENPNLGVVSNLVNTMQGTELYFPEHDSDIKALLMETCALVHPTSMIRKSVLLNNNIMYEEEYSPAEDYRLWCKLIGITEFYNIQEVLFIYRDHEENTSSKQKEKMQNATSEIHKHVRKEHFPLYYYHISTCNKASSRFLPKAKRLYKVKLFSCIPFLFIEKNNDVLYFKLFGIIPLFSIKGR